jgi:hypothetical protein
MLYQLSYVRACYRIALAEPFRVSSRERLIGRC